MVGVSVGAEKKHPIQVVARRTGLSADVLRAWQKRYGAIAPERSAGGRRLYSDGDIERLRLLRRVTVAGRSIGQVARLPTAELARLAREDETQEAGVRQPSGAVRGGAAGPAYLERCLAAVHAFDTSELEATLSVAVVALGAAELMEQVVVPLLERIGDAWAAGQLSVAHEHVASAVARQFLGALILAWEGRTGAPTIVVGTPVGEHHEFGAMMAAATAVVAGWRVTYLGPDLPADAIALAAGQPRARAVALSVVHPHDIASVESEVRAVREGLPRDTTLLVGGRQAAALGEVLADIGAVHVPDLAGLRTYLATAGGDGPRQREGRRGR